MATIIPIQAWADIENEIFDINSFTITYGLNMIPVASNVTVSPAENQSITDSALKMKNLAEKSANGKPWVRIHVGCNYNPWYTLFDGYLMPINVQAQRTNIGGKIAYTLTLKHWLSDLVDVPTMSKALGEIDPANNFLARVNKEFQKGTEAKPCPAPAILANLTNNINIVDDLWGNYLLKVFQALTGGEFWEGQTWDRAHAILNEQYFNPSWMNPVPLELDRRWLNEDLTLLWEEIFSNQLAGEVFSMYWNANLWQALVSLAQKLLFAIVPCVNGVGVLPVCPLYGKAYAQLDIEDANDIEIRGTPQTIPIGGVVVMGQRAGLATEGQAYKNKVPLTKYGAIGIWPPAMDIHNTGKILYLNAPPWLSSAAGLTCGVDTQREIAGTEAVYERMIPPLDIDQYRPEPEQRDLLVNWTRSFYSGYELSPAMQYARYMYLNHLFAPRILNVASTLRVDIAPGSIVKINGVGALAGYSGGPDFYAMVNSIVYHMERTNRGGMVRTTFMVTHVRTEQENDEYAIYEHPIYTDQMWTGCPLLGVISSSSSGSSQVLYNYHPGSSQTLENFHPSEMLRDVLEGVMHFLKDLG